MADADMEFTTVRIRSMGQLHAVLIVRYQGRIYVLDNLRKEVQGPERLRDLQLVYFINRVGWHQ